MLGTRRAGGQMTAERMEGGRCVNGSQEAGWVPGTDVGFDPRSGVPRSSARVGDGWGWGEGHLRRGRCEFLRGTHSHRLWRIEQVGYSGDTEPPGGRPRSGWRSPPQLDSSGH